MEAVDARLAHVAALAALAIVFSFIMTPFIFNGVSDPIYLKQTPIRSLNVYLTHLFDTNVRTTII